MVDKFFFVCVYQPTKNRNKKEEGKVFFLKKKVWFVGNLFAITNPIPTC